MSGPMGLVYETPGDPSTSDVWGVALNLSFQTIEGHTHELGKGVQVPSGGIGINADLSFASFALTFAKTITFVEQAPASMTSYSSALFANSSDHNLYWRNSSGTNVQLTSGSTINFSVAGAIGGDYAAVNALLDFTDANHIYGFHQQVGASVRQYGKIGSADLSLFEFKANPATGVPSQAVTLKSPTALAASYAFTFPAGLPALTTMLTCDATGLVGLGGSIAMANNASITISGTGTYRQGVKTKRAAVFLQLCSTASAVTQSAGTQGITLPNNATVYIPVPQVEMHQRWTGVELWFSSAANATACTCELFTSSNANPDTGALTTMSTFLTSGGTAVASTTISTSPVNAQTLWIKVTNSVTTPSITAVGCLYDTP